MGQRQSQFDARDSTLSFDFAVDCPAGRSYPRNSQRQLTESGRMHVISRHKTLVHAAIIPERDHGVLLRTASQLTALELFASSAGRR